MVEYRTPLDWDQWVDELAEALHGRNRWRLTVLIMGMVFAKGRRTVSSWLRAVGLRNADTLVSWTTRGIWAVQGTRETLESSTERGPSKRDSGNDEFYRLRRLTRTVG
jgi:hypothetical protein